MTLELARSGRIAALSHRNADRVLVRPARHKSDVTLPEEGTVAAYLIDALGQGSTVDQIVAETGWSKSTVLVNLYKVAKKSGIGIRRRQDTLHLLVPRGAENVYPRKHAVRRPVEAGNFVGNPVKSHHRMN
ncbi:hypothetical protein KX928_04335 [Roseobacter sp. YSTF-M11]|uniref:Uncharacterized protein n=1 Tax=Roseobacter insulae TaxID=2859783 RepID=A0A9X1JXI6_9RHOB|nr:hypothetical protein [Roseobacter insulae]MBW4707011.1 hypothetical protein [Roseobacter insulae]